jgi:3-oxoacyl-[acyl-carrier protein] reductase
MNARTLVGRRLDIIVVNAGILRLGPVETVSLEDLDRTLYVKLRGVFVAIQAAAPRLTDGGRAITIGSNTAIRTGFPGSSVYSMTKAAVATMVKGIALDLAPRAITVNNIQPGPTRDAYDSRSPGDGESPGSARANWPTT